MNRRLLVLLLLLFTAISAFAQIDKGSIEAVALDQSKSPLPGVTVTVARPETGYSNMAVTDSAGAANFPALQPGNYEVSFALEGFAPVTAQKLVLRVGQQAKVAVTLQAAASETITVSAEAPVVDVHKTDSSTNIVPEQIESLPVQDRDFQRLAFIAPGVQRERGGFRFINGGPVVGAGGNASQTTIFVN
ncbi:MAG TPA: carboxypeptidase-like regulatory domain-containing protein, partial [Thermoanaerobaculia bacterium]|nr:carboxypeptidase-like regulatory domain-containing protein [Thermoanaerobaculia bacterium]